MHYTLPMERMPESPEADFVQENADLEPVIREGLRELFSYELPEYFMDSGGAGSVYSLPQGFCVKILEARHTSPHREILNLGNTALQEGHFQEIMSNTIQKSTTRTPKIFGVLTSAKKDSKSAIIMEKLNAVNLEHVLHKKIHMPGTFNVDSFFDNLETYVQHMQDFEGIIHGDLFPRNIMVDIETGDPRVIDWGRSKFKREVKDKRQLKKFLDDEWERLDILYESLVSLQI